MFGRLSKRKWEHKDPVVREHSVLVLDPFSAKDHDILAMLAQSDNELSVRLAAIAKLQSFNLIKSIFDKSQQPEEKELALERIKSLLCNVLNELDDRTLLFDFLASDALSSSEQFDIAIKTTDPEIGMKIISDLRDESALVKAALFCKTVKTRMHAAEKLNSLDSLRQLQKKSVDKAVLQFVREKLKASKDRESEFQAQHASLEKLCLAVERLAEKDCDKLYENRLNVLSAQWDGFDKQVKSVYQSRFDQALTQCRLIVEVVKAAQLKRERINTAMEAAQLVCDQLQIFQAELQEDAGAFETERFAAFLEAKRLAWRQVSEVQQPDHGRAAQYHKVTDGLIAYQEARIRLNQYGGQLAALLEMDASKEAGYAEIKACQHELIAINKKIAWPGVYAKPRDLQALEKQSALFAKKLSRWEEERRSKSRSIGKKLVVLQREISKRNLIAANKLYHFLHKQITELDEPYRQQEEARLEKTNQLLDELRDWCEFATLPKKEVICEEMEALISKELPVIERAHQVKRLQEAWKELGTTNTETDRVLWERFKAAAGQAYQPCLAYYEIKDKFRAENLKKRLEICDQLSHFLEVTDWTRVDWHQIEFIEKKAWEEWGLYKAIPLDESEAIQTRFNQLVGEIRNHLDAERDTNLEERKTLVKKAEALLAQDDIEDAVSGAQKLQQKWKTLGLTYRSQDHRQWKLFKMVCDNIFKRRDAFRVEQQKKNDDVIKNANALLDEFKQLATLPDDRLSENRTRYLELKKDFTELLIGLPLRQARHLEKSFDNIDRDYRNQLKGIGTRQQQRQLEAIAEAAKFCIQLEAAAFRNEAVDADALQHEFGQSIKNVPDDIKVDMQARFDLAMQAQGSRQIGVLQEQSSEHQRQLEQLAMELEILTDIESPEPFKAARMAFQLLRLQSGMQAKLADQLQHTNVNDLLMHWYRIGAVNPETREVLESRVQKVLKSVSSNGWFV